MNYPTNLQHVAMYLRKSRADVEAEARGEGETLSKHRKALLDLAEKKKYTVRAVFEEIVSGERIVDRPEMQKLLHQVRDNQYDAVLCMDMDRLGRGNMIDQGLIQESFKSSQTLIITPRKVYNLDDEMDEEWSEFEAFMARRELKLITRRMQRGRQMSALDGRSVSKKPPYGYLRGEDNRLYPDPELAKIVRLIYEMYANGIGLTKIAHNLDDLNAPVPDKLRVIEKWDKTTVRDILHNEVYLGHIVWGKYRSFKSETGKRKRERVPRDRWIVAENAHEPIISLELWDRVRQLQKPVSPHLKRNHSLKNPLAGLIKCSECGKTMLRRESKSSGTGPLIRCPTYKCKTKSSVLARVEEDILTFLRTRVVPRMPNAALTAPNKTSDSELELNQRKLNMLENELSKLQVQSLNLHDLLEQGVYDISTFTKRNKNVSDRLENLAVEKEQCKQAIAILLNKQSCSPEWIPPLCRAIEIYDSAEDTVLKNQILKAIVQSIRYRRHRNWPKERDFELEITLRI